MRSTNLKTKPIAATASRTEAKLEQLEDRKYQSSNHEIGINVNAQSSADYAKSLPILKQLGVTTVRLWYGVNDWDNKTVNGALSRAIEYHNAGYDVMMTVSISDRSVPNPADVKSWFGWAANNDALANAVDRWEIGNEVDSSNYFKGTLKQYVSNFLKPASQALHAAGEKVVSAGMSWNPQDVQEIINDGALDMVDYIGFHPYAKGVGQMKNNIATLQQIVAGRKPLLSSEWNVRGFEGDKTAWATAVKDAYSVVHSGFDLDYYYCLFTANTMAGPAGLVDRNGTPNASFYNSFLQASRGGVGTTPTGGTGSTGGGTGNTPAGAGTQIALYNATTDRVISGYTNLKAGQVIDLAALPTRNLAIVVVPNRTAGSVKLNLNGQINVENTAPYSVFGDNGTDLNGRTLATGAYTLKATPYQKINSGGNAYATSTLNFKIVDSKQTTPTPPPVTPAGPDVDVTSYSLIDAKTGKVITGYSNITGNQTISLASLPSRSLALRANVEGDATSVKVTANGKTHIENTAPYAVFYDNFGKYYAWTPGKSTWHISGVAYDQDNAKGTHGNNLSVTLKFV